MSLVLSRSVDETIEIGARFSGDLKKGDIVALYGGIGAGKTHFIKGVTKGFGFEMNVTSPTFNIVHEYMTDASMIYHFDFYRLENPRELINIGFEEYLFGDGICLVEWAEKVTDFLPGKIWTVQIKQTGKNRREIEILFK